MIKINILAISSKGSSLYEDGFFESINSTTITTTNEGMGTFTGSGSFGESNVVAQSPSYTRDFVFFKDLDLSIVSVGLLSYLFLINIILQLYILIYFCKSIFIKEYIFSYVGIIKKISFSFWEFFIFCFVGLFYIFIFYFLVIYDLNLETTQVVVSDNSHNHKMNRLILQSIRFFILTSLGIEVEPPCKDGECFD